MYKTELLTELKSLDLTQEPREDIIRILKEIFEGGIPVMTTDYNYPKEFERAVNNTDDEPLFKTKSRISYKPKEFNNNYLRASTPDNTMFYASVIPEGELTENEIKHARLIGLAETSDLLRNNLNGERHITFGEWQIQSLISVITIFDPNKDYHIKYINDVRDSYNSQNISSEEIEKRDELLSFLASEFSKKVENGKNHDYMISAIFAELVSENGADGVLYPSVQSDGYGLCVALHPRVMERLKLIKVLQCKLDKKGINAQLNNVKYCDVENNSETFELKEIIMGNQIDIAAHRLAISFADDIDVPVRFKNKSDKQNKINPDSSVEIRFKEDVKEWKKLISIMLKKIEQDLAWRFINIAPKQDNSLKSVAYQKDFCVFMDYLVLRRDVENCDAEELGRLAMLSGAFQRELEKKLSSNL